MSSEAETRPMAINLPNQLTLARVVMVPVFVALMSFQHYVCYTLGYLLFIAAVITDYYDGKIARARNMVTNFGKLMDPLADKILMAAAFVMAMAVEPLHIPSWTVVVILSREFLVTGIRSLAVAEGAVIAAELHGKIKTAAQMTFIIIFLPMAIAIHALAETAPAEAARYGAYVGTASLWAVVAVAMYTVYSGIHYLVSNWRILNLGLRV